MAINSATPKIVLITIFGLMLLPNWYDRKTNIVPGEGDYAVANSKATHIIEATFLIPPTLHVHFNAVYTTSFGRGVSPKPNLCHYATKTGTATEYSISLNEFSVSIPLDLKYQGDEGDKAGHSRRLKSYRADVAVDQYQPGRCQWKFDRVIYSTDDNNMESFQVFRFDEKQGFRSNDLDPVANRFTYFWCTTRAETREMPSHEVCSGPRSGYNPQSPSRHLSADDIVFTQNSVSNFTVSNGLTKLLFEFYDVDNLNPEAPNVEMIP